jgi:hypothetical protein
MVGGCEDCFFLLFCRPDAYFAVYNSHAPISVIAWSMAWVCSHSLAGIVGSNVAGGMDVRLL